MIGALEVAGAVGVLAGLAVPEVGFLSAVGLTIVMAAAVGLVALRLSDRPTLAVLVVVVAEVLMAAVVGSMVAGAALTVAAAESTVARGGSTKAAVLTERVALTMDAGSVILTAAAPWTAVHGSTVPPGSMLAEAWMEWGDSTALPDSTEPLASTARADLPAMQT